MESKYCYNSNLTDEIKNEFYEQKIINKIKKNIYNDDLKVALQKLYKYNQQYPKDIYGNILIADVLCRLGRFDDAKKWFETIEITSKNLDCYKAYYIIMKIQLLGYFKQYNTSLACLEENEKFLTSNDCNITKYKLFLQKQCEKIISNNYNGYLSNQIINYSEEKAIEHIYKHEYGVELEKGIFSFSFPIVDIFNKIRNIIPCEKRIYENFADNYYFKYYNSGTSNGIKVDYFKVVTISDTNHIITMYPCSCEMKDMSIDINPQIEIEKCKKISQIDKFKMRYRM